MTRRKSLVIQLMTASDGWGVTQTPRGLQEACRCELQPGRTTWRDKTVIPTAIR